MRIAIITESFLPSINGVTNSVIQARKSLLSHGYDVLIIAPDGGPTADTYEGSKLVRLPAVNLKNSLPVALPSPAIERVLRAYAPDIVHLASPAIMGAFAQRVCSRLGIPTIAVYQTDFVGFSRHYRMGFATHGINQLVKSIHGNATLNLAPSQYATNILLELGIKSVARWGRGVDLELFNPMRRSIESSRRGKKILGFVGRLAPEKEIHKLAQLASDPRFQIEIVGDGPERLRLQELMPQAHFAGRLTGAQLAESIANFDCFIHPGEHETFCQAAQEALSSGVPVIAPIKGAVREFVIDGFNGLTVDMSKSNSLKEISDDHWNLLFSSEFKINARNSVANRSWDSVNSELISHYRSIVSQREPLESQRAS